MTVLVGVVVGGLLVAQNVARAERIEEADDVAADYLSEVSTFRADIATALREAGDDPGALRAALRKSSAEPPTLAEADPAGIEESTTYARALQVQGSLLDPYRELAQDLKAADEGLTWVAAAREVLSLRASDYVEGYLLTDSGQVRSSLIPAFVRARDRLAAVPVPEGQDRLAATVSTAVQTVIDRATQLAASIEQGSSYTFSYSDVYQAATTALNDYATQVDGDLTEALNATADLAEE